MSSDFGISTLGADFSDEPRGGISYWFTDANICGESASCVVYRMHLDGMRVAVKRLKPEFRANPLYVAAYEKEFLIGRRLKHDALPVYRELHDDTDEVFIVMDYVDGIVLNEFIEGNEGQQYFSSEDNVHRFITELLGVTAYLHRSGVIHCDLKPANIILRHSDRGVMLIDLDKAYSDTLERTHGGTANISDPLSSGEVPTAEKDYRAIGRIIDEIAEKVPHFPWAKFRKFRIACDREGITAERLQKLLKSSADKKWWIIGVLCFLALFTISLTALFYRPAGTSVSPASAASGDTVVIRMPQQQAEPVRPVSPGTPAPRIDIDAKMAAFVWSADSVLSRLNSGRLSNSEINSLVLDITAKYTADYGAMVNAYKKSYPTVPGMDIELAVAKASERSRALHLLQQFTQAAADTIQHRQPKLYQ